MSKKKSKTLYFYPIKNKHFYKNIEFGKPVLICWHEYFLLCNLYCLIFSTYFLSLSINKFFVFLLYHICTTSLSSLKNILTLLSLCYWILVQYSSKIHVATTDLFINESHQFLGRGEGVEKEIESFLTNKTFCDWNLFNSSDLKIYWNIRTRSRI